MHARKLSTPAWNKKKQFIGNKVNHTSTSKYLLSIVAPAFVALQSQNNFQNFAVTLRESLEFKQLTCAALTI